MSRLDEARATIDEVDRELLALFERRMQAVEEVAAYKRETGKPVPDEARERELLARNVARLSRPELRREYEMFQRAVMASSRAYQHRLVDDFHVTFPDGRGYDIILRRGALYEVGELCRLDRRALIVTDDGVPRDYVERVKAQCRTPVVVTIPQGEASKDLASYESLLTIMLREGFTRSDCVVAVGGGVVGDLAGFVAASYMRGVDFYNFPTTLLSQVDSSVGGKTAIDLDGVKNPVGAFKQPTRVVIDPDVLSTLDARQFAAGMAEVVKMAATHDPALFSLIETGDVHAEIEGIIRAALTIKRQVVEADETEGGLRRVLNFGHTVGHAIESAEEGNLLHGECVALGMLYLSSPPVRTRLKNLYQKLSLPTTCEVVPRELTALVARDKKMRGDVIHYVWVEEIGHFAFRSSTLEEFEELLTGGTTV